MIRKLQEFFEGDKKYAFLAILVSVIMLFMWLSPNVDKKTGETTPQVEQFKQAEKKLQEQIKEKGNIQEYLKDHPDEARNIGLVTGLFGLFFLAGIFIDAIFIARPSFRDSLDAPPPAPVTTPWKLSMIAKVVLLFITGSFAMGATMAVLRNFTDKALSLNFYMVFHTVVMDLLCVWFMFKIVRQSGGHIRDLGLQIPSKNPGKEIGFAVGAYAAILPVFLVLLLVLLAIAQLFKYEPPPHPLVNVFLEEDKKAEALVNFSVILAAMLGPVFEELFFRGFCYNILKSRFGAAAAAVVSASFFAFIHENSFAFWPIFVLGLILAYAYEKRGTLLAPIVLHMTHNSLFLFYFFAAKDLVKLASG